MVLFIIPLLILFVLIRTRWVLYQHERYVFKVCWFCWRTKQPDTVLKEMYEIWPAGQILLEFWKWDWCRYVVRQDHLERMNDFLAQEEQRNDLGPEIFKSDTPHDNSQN
jgi:hypothetical protein